MKSHRFIVAITASFISLSGCYYINQGMRLAELYGKAKPIEKINGSKEPLPEDEKALLDLVTQIKTYATSDLGLADNGNYASYIRTDRSYMADVVSACAPDSFDQYLFDYPIMGKLPYKGFFRREDALAEAERLEHEGYDVYVRGVAAFSTLGIFKDPVMSYMKAYPPSRLAELIIHEQTHATVFWNGYPDASENLAMFVGEKGAFDFIARTYGPQSAEMILARDGIADGETYMRLIFELRDTLAAVYESPITPDEKHARKAEAIGSWKNAITASYGDLFRTESYAGIADAPINNAFIATFLNYTNNLGIFERLYVKSGNDIRTMMTTLATLDRSVEKDPEKCVTRLLDSP